LNSISLDFQKSPQLCVRCTTLVQRCTLKAPVHTIPILLKVLDINSLYGIQYELTMETNVYCSL